IQDPDGIQAIKEKQAKLEMIRHYCMDSIAEQLDEMIESGLFLAVLSVDATFARFWTRHLQSMLSSIKKTIKGYKDVVKSIDDFIGRPFSLYDSEAACKAFLEDISDLISISKRQKDDVEKDFRGENAFNDGKVIVRNAARLQFEKMENFDWLRSEVEKAVVAYYNQFKCFDIHLLRGFVSSLYGTTTLEKEFAMFHIECCQELFVNGHVPSPCSNLQSAMAQPLVSQQSVSAAPTVNKTSKAQPVTKFGRVPLRGVTRGLKLSSPQPASDAAVDAVLAGACGNDEVEVPLNSSIVPVPALPVSATPTDLDDLVMALSSVSVKRDEFDEMVDAFTLLSINIRRQHNIGEAVDALKSMSLEKHPTIGFASRFARFISFVEICKGKDRVELE
ncbi:hypothetical protein HDU76_001625, partial [Blyttiomyces sp. JEL0837]